MDTTPTPRRGRKTTDREIAAIKAPGRHSVGDHLILVVTPAGTRSWIARITDPAGRRRDIGLGKYPKVSLKQAREDAAKLWHSARNGEDPVQAKRARARTIPTFSEAAKSYHDERKKDFRSQALADQWFRTLRDYTFRRIGSTTVEQITAPIVREILRPIWSEKPETARRVLRRIAAVIEWSVAHGYREHELPRASIRKGLGKQPDNIVSHPAVAYQHAPSFIAALRQKQTFAAYALELAILTGCRSGEARGARWSEFDLDNALWSIPAARMKMDRPHLVPLPTAAMSLLRMLEATKDGSGLVFPGASRSRDKAGRRIAKPLSDVALSKIQKALAPGSTVHGWRATFRTWSAEQVPNLPREIAEAVLAHGNPKSIEERYRRTNFLELRRPLMEAWSSYLGGGQDWAAHLPEFRRASIVAIAAAA